jgi:predicted amidohydrolase
MVIVGLAEAVDERVFNTAVAVTGEGVLARYRKLHLFDREKESFTPGDLGLPVVETPFGCIGLCICYDLRFPEVARILALRDVEVICAPAAWVRGFDRVPTEVPGQVQGLVVQANLNQVFIACASQVGEPGAHRFLGWSVVVDPFGAIVAGPLSSEEPAAAAAQLDLARCEAARRRSELITPRADRRTDVYGLVYDGEPL